MQDHSGPVFPSQCPSLLQLVSRWCHFHFYSAVVRVCVICWNSCFSLHHMTVSCITVLHRVWCFLFCCLGCFGLVCSVLRCYFCCWTVFGVNMVGCVSYFPPNEVMVCYSKLLPLLFLCRGCLCVSPHPAHRQLKIIAYSKSRLSTIFPLSYNIWSIRRIRRFVLSAWIFGEDWLQYLPVQVAWCLDGQDQINVMLPFFVIAKIKVVQFSRFSGEGPSWRISPCLLGVPYKMIIIPFAI